LFLDGKLQKINKIFIQDIGKLSEIEIECLVLLIRGFTIYEISVKLSLNKENVKKNINVLLAKTEVKNLIELSRLYKEI
jgi:DNA-binding NarL/FixJ family response regulator